MKSFAIFLFIILFPLVNAASLSMSPQQINFNGGANEEICNKVTLKTEGKDVLLGEDKWAEKGYNERKLKQHNLSGDYFKLNLEYPSALEVNYNETIDVCLTGKNTGSYHGILLYRVEGKPVRVGIWMQVNITKNENYLIKKLTNNITDLEINKIAVSLSIVPLLSFGILLGLLIKLKKKKQK